MTAVADAPLAAEIARVGRLGHLTAAHLADATGGDPSSARRWLRGTQAPSGAHAARALELTSLVERLAQLMQPTYIPIWLINRSSASMTGAPSTSSGPATIAVCRGSSPRSKTCPWSRCPLSTSTPAASRDVFVRHIPRGADPLYQPPEPADGRLQRGATVAAWYFADEPDTAWAEWYRALAGTALPPARAVPRDLWRWRIDLAQVALLDDDTRLARVGLPPPRPAQQQWPACQQIGDALHNEGYGALLVASAARSGHRNVVVFRTQHRTTGCTPQPPPTLMADVPPVPQGMRT